MPFFLPKPPFPVLDRGHRLANGLVAGWTFSEGSGTTLYDIRDNTFPAALQGAPPWAGSPLGHSVNFNGSSQYATVAGTLWTPGTANQSWLAWVIPSSTAIGVVAGQDNNPVTNNRATQFMINSTSGGSNVAGNWTFGCFNQGNTANLLAHVASNVVTVGNLWFLAGVRTGPLALALYRNGVRETVSQANSGTPSVPALNAVQIGTRNFAGNIQFFPGKILQVLHYNRALSPSEIAEFAFDAFAPFRKRTPISRYAVVNRVLTPALFTNTNTFYAPVVHSTYNLTPGLVTNANSFYAPTVHATYSLTPGLFSNSSTFYAPTVSTTWAISANLFTNTNTFYSPVVNSTISLAPDLFENSNLFPSPTISTFYAVNPSLLENQNDFFGPVVVYDSTLRLHPNLFTNISVFYSPVLTLDLGHLISSRFAAVIDDLPYVAQINRLAVNLLVPETYYTHLVH